MPVPENLPFKRTNRGDTVGPIVLNIKSDTDITGASVVMTFRINHEGGDVVQTLKSDDGQIEVDAANKKITVLKFKPLVAGTNFWDLEVTFSNGDVQTPFEGEWEIKPDRTPNV